MNRTDKTMLMLNTRFVLKLMVLPVIAAVVSDKPYKAGFPPPWASAEVWWGCLVWRWPWPRRRYLQKRERARGQSWQAAPHRANQIDFPNACTWAFIRRCSVAFSSESDSGTERKEKQKESVKNKCKGKLKKGYCTETEKE